MQVNLVTAWIDGSSIYGPSASWSDFLRNFSGGLLASGSEQNMPNEEGGRTLMWSAADPSTGDHGPDSLYGETQCSQREHVRGVTVQNKLTLPPLLIVEVTVYNSKVL